MPSSFTTLKSLEKQATGENENTWGDNLNDVLDMIDTALGGRLSLSVAGSANVTLTAAQALNPIQEYTGTLTGSIAVIVPTASGWYLVRNATAGAYTLTVKTSGGTGIAIPQGYRALLYCDGTNVVQVAGAGMGAIPYRAITGTDTIVAADRGALIDATSGTFSLAVTAVATLGAGFFCWVRNSGSGVVTIDPDSTEQIDGAASRTLGPGQSCMVVCNGALLRTVGLDDPTTTRGDLIYRAATGPARLAVGAANRVLRSDGTDPAWGQVVIADIATAAFADAAAMEARTGALIVTPDVQHRHPAHCKAWVQFNGTGTVAIDASYGVSSITDNGTGDYSVNFSTNFSAANYACAFGCGGNALGNYSYCGTLIAIAVGAARFVTANVGAGGTPVDVVRVSAAFFGDHA